MIVGSQELCIHAFQERPIDALLGGFSAQEQIRSHRDFGRWDCTSHSLSCGVVLLSAHHVHNGLVDPWIAVFEGGNELRGWEAMRCCLARIIGGCAQYVSAQRNPGGWDLWQNGQWYDDENDKKPILRGIGWEGGYISPVSSLRWKGNMT